MLAQRDRVRTAGVIAALAGVALLVAGLAWQSRRAGRSTPVALDAGTPAALEVQVSGCSAFTLGPTGGVCEVAPSAELHMWMPGLDSGDVRVSVDGRPVTAELTSWPDGRAASAVVPGGASELRVSTSRGGAAATYRLRLAPPRAVPPVVEKARALRDAGRLEEAMAALATPAEDDPAASDVLALRARVQMQLGHVEEAIADFHASIARQRAQGRLSQEARDAFALAFMLVERSRIAEARAVVEEAARMPPGYPAGPANVLYYEGLLAWHVGDLRTALRRTREADARFARLGSPWRIGVRISLGLQLLDLGRYDEAIAVFRELLDKHALEPCEASDLMDDIAWSELLQMDAAPEGATLLDPREVLKQALAGFRSSCPDPNRMANALENMGLAELLRGRLDEATAALAEARKVERNPETPVVLFWHHLTGRIALARHAPAEAAVAFAREAALAAAIGTSDDQRSAAEGQAAALSALGRKTDALAALDAADALLDASSESVPLGEGRGAYLGARDRAAARRVELLLELGRAPQAMVAARRWRARLLEGLRVTTAVERLDAETRGRWEDAIGRYRAVRDAMDSDTKHDWELPADALTSAQARRQQSAARARGLLDEALSLLPQSHATAAAPSTPAPGEVELLYMPAPSGWLGFARTADAVSATHLERIDPSASPAELARTMLRPFEAEIGLAKTVRLLPYGAAREVDVQALPWHERPLLEHAVVTYALGLDATPPTSSARRALVVADPRGDLPAARAEADAVTEALRAGGDWSVQSLRGTGAQAEQVRSAAAAVDLLHYAGHASFGGVDGIDSALSLAGGSSLTPADVLAMPHVPDVVALFGCDTAHEFTTGAVDALGLTSAFLVAGSRVVVATARQVDDGLARDVAAEFYARLAHRDASDAPEALRGAVLAVRARAPGGDWSAFRVLVP